MTALDPRILNLMQFARKAGKLVPGIDACLRSMHQKHINLIVIAADTAERTAKRISFEMQNSGVKLLVIQAGTQAEISSALGLPLTGVFGISDKNFAAKISEYWQA
ncbi:MAG: ribosomal L7Ae/L30e/S12e/Gadd45 family protein [Candidatus Cloacimonetes bacterium]|jgi:ribosomal protein L7Ae-like RNA K-turn-binding protein|nr:ribosomal L7Ae/L30e/S12e/Gadd45 family protein [Candidatus Cloacimonadota bacterium]MDY0299315.1 ribosomal L7Ae/L30e/S12e/Gadd45 family protein [Candidatus Cloacimonadaceae bacterium]MCB5279422.1 ribosomal L7Ae/L30e/S12e/Gadd45 family protein [Candidatus Cloacimonadota bacterium]MCK9333144.1 ribosomal L7Ae/L30e/S12e/Gadd45 family protein [Candidatus Cloacimonadota bacterium]MDD2211248.1 ribosomal L7Ae/L30e/S12e/Gadd45 family protein [Candidatus Cloacimonadota bacterium]